MLSKFVRAGLVGLAIAAAQAPAQAAEVTLRLHQFLPPQGTIPRMAIKPWAEKIEKESEGRIEIRQFHAMQLGGTPGTLYDQAKDGVVDIIWTVLGYTPGRFPKAEVFDLPFMVTTAEATSQAFHAFYEKHLTDEFKDVKVLAVHTHGPGLLHSKQPIEKLEDMRGVKIRGGSRVINDMLDKLGSTPVGMPVTGVSEALSKGVIDATTIPWEVTIAFKVPELVENHTGFAGGHGLYTATFVFAMNQASYDKLPDDLKKVIDDNSGIELAAAFGRAMDAGDEVGIEFARKLGNNIITLDDAETKRWRDAAQPVIDDWTKASDAAGIEGTVLYRDAVELVRKYGAQ